MDRTTVELGIGGMTCASCVAALEESLERVPGVERVSVNLATERATLTFDPKTTSVQALTEAIEETGYQARTETITFPIQGMSCAACVAAQMAERLPMYGGRHTLTQYYSIRCADLLLSCGHRFAQVWRRVSGATGFRR